MDNFLGFEIDELFSVYQDGEEIGEFQSREDAEQACIIFFLIFDESLTHIHEALVEGHTIWHSYHQFYHAVRAKGLHVPKQVTCGFGLTCHISYNYKPIKTIFA
jgi:hypothetical protein